MKVPIFIRTLFFLLGPALGCELQNQLINRLPLKEKKKRNEYAIVIKMLWRLPSNGDEIESRND